MSECEVVQDVNITTEFDITNLKSYQIAWVVAGICVVISVGFSLHLMLKHITSYRRPEQQKHILRILLMVPIYSICSFCSLRFIGESFIFDAIRSCYEAFVIYSFYALILNYMGSDHSKRKAALQVKPDGKYPFPFNCFYYNPRSGGFLKTCTRGVLQYALIHPITSLIAVVLELNGTLCASSYSWKHPMVYLVGVEMVSVCLAMYFLVVFYHVVHDDISQFKVINKFLAVKFVIFFSFWQSVVLSFLSSAGIIHETPAFSVHALSSQIQNFLICLEMVIAAVWHEYCFPSESYELEGQQTSFVHGIKDIVLPVDLIKDTKNAMKMKRKPKPENVEMASIKTKSARTSLSQKKYLDDVNLKSNMVLGSPDDAPLITDEDIAGFHTTDEEAGKVEHSDAESLDTNPDAEGMEIEDDLEGVGIIRLNPVIQAIMETEGGETEQKKQDKNN